VANQHLHHGGWHSCKIGSRSALWPIWCAHTHYAHVGGRGPFPVCVQVSSPIYMGKCAESFVVVMICWICTKVYSYVLDYYGFKSWWVPWIPLFRVSTCTGLHVTLHDKSLGWQWPLVEDGMPVGLGLCNCWWEPSSIQLVFTSLMVTRIWHREVAWFFLALLALYCIGFFYKYSDDCPLGNYNQVKRAGLMVERNAVDSFQSGAMNMNSWVLFFWVSIQCNECMCLWVIV
jgi:hypothetical protein